MSEPAQVAPPAKRKAGRPKKYTPEELAEHRREYQRRYYSEHKAEMYDAQKRSRARKLAQTPPTTA